MQPVAVNQAQETIQRVVGLVVLEDRDTLIAMLRKNGASINDNISDENLIKVTYLAIAKSNNFKKDFSDYLLSTYTEEQKNYVQEDFFNQTGKEKRELKKEQRVAKRKEVGGTKVGNALRGVATSENIGAVINTGIGVIANKLTAKADQKSIQDATNLAAQKSQQALAEAKLEEQKAKTKRWIIPVAIGGILIVGGIIFFVMRKKGKA